MKRIRLEFPYGKGKFILVYMPYPVYFKVADTQAEAFIDKDFTQSVPQTEKKISLEVEVPEELEVIEVMPPNRIPPVLEIEMDWRWDGADPNWKIPGLQKVLIVLEEGKTHEVPVFDEKPDFEEWAAFNSAEGEGRRWFVLPWALAIYVTDTKTFGRLHWHYKLARRL